MFLSIKKANQSREKKAWPSDRLQVLAYTLLLSEHTGEDIGEARIRYHADSKTICLDIGHKEAEEEVNAAVSGAELLRNSTERPPVSVPEYLCRTCSLAPGSFIFDVKTTCFHYFATWIIGRRR